MLVDVLAVGLHHLTRARASGTHYSSTVALPAVPGADGVDAARMVCSATSW